jgi:hypothetical protein
MDIWESKSNSGQQTALAIGCTLVGLIFIIGLRNVNAWNSNSAAGFFLGVLLFVLGLAGLVVSGRQTVQVDPKLRQILITDTNRFGTERRTISFSDIDSIHTGFLGKRSNFVGHYYLILTLKSGEKYPLFAPGRFFKDGSDRGTVMEWKHRLESYLNQHEI